MARVREYLAWELGIWATFLEDDGTDPWVVERIRSIADQIKDRDDLDAEGRSCRVCGAWLSEKSAHTHDDDEE